MPQTDQWQPARLVAVQEGVQPAWFTIEADVCLIGRSPLCNVIVAQPIVSRLHATIERDEVHRYILRDNNSANGTFINGQPKPIDKLYLLKNLDELGLGSPKPVLRFEDEAATSPAIISRITYDESNLIFSLDSHPLTLTPSQLRLMQHLYKHAYNLCTRQSCAEALWQQSYDPARDDQALDRIMSNLRQQLHQIASDADLIVTRRGVGYTLMLNS